VSQSNVDLVRRVHEALNTRDERALPELFDPEFVWVQNPNAPDPRTFHGHDGIRELVATVDDAFDEVRLEPAELIEVGDRVVVLGQMKARGKGSGIPIEEDRAWIWTVRDGKVVRHETYADHPSALEAAGLKAEDSA